LLKNKKTNCQLISRVKKTEKFKNKYTTKS